MQVDRETVIALAAEHAICTSADSKEFDHEGLERFAQAIFRRAAAAEREACAQILFRNAEGCNNGMARLVLQSNAQAIRARATKNPAHNQQPAQATSDFVLDYWRDRSGRNEWE